MKTIIVANRKGGVGKTTIAAHLAAGLSLLGFRTSLVDVDSQGHSATAFGLPKTNGLHTIMTDYEATFAHVLNLIPPESYTPPGWEAPTPLYLLPSDKMTSRLPVDQPSPFRFRTVLRDLAELLELEYIIVDTGPSNSMFDGSVMLAADYYLYVTEAAALSFDGLTEATAELEQMNREAAEYRSTPIRIMGIIPNKLRASTNNHRENVAQLGTHFEPGLVWTPIPMRTIFETAFEYGQLVYSFAAYGVEFRSALEFVNRALITLGEITPDDTTIRDLMEKPHVATA